MILFLTQSRHRYAPGLVAVVAATMLSACGATDDAPYPSEPITFVVNWPAGGGMDRAGRLVAEFARRRVDVPIAVINVAGSGGASGVRHVAEADPDGYTVGILGASLVASQYINPNANAIDEIDLLAFMGPDPAALEVRADTGIDSLAEFVEHARAAPGALKNGNDAPGGVSHIAATLLERAANVELTLVPYRGYAPTVAAILSGEVQTATLPVHQLIDQHEAGDVRILGVMAEERHFMAPDVPTFREQGIDLVTGDWRAVYAPNGIPAERREFLETLFFETLSDPEFRAAAEQQSFFVAPLASRETQQFVERFDAELYPALLAAGLVKARHK